MDTFMGINIITSDLISARAPKIQLKSNVTVTYEFRSDFNNWLANRFGDKEVFYMADGKGVITHPNNLQELRRQIALMNNNYHPNHGRNV